MPLVIPRRWRRLGLLAAAALAVSAAPAQAAPANPDGCVVDHVLSNPFAAWGDTADYALAPAGDFESAGWDLQGAAATVAGNQPFDIGAVPGTSSLGLGGDGVALSDPMCIDETYPHFRFFARGSANATVKAEVQFLDEDGSVQSRDSSSWSLSERGWALSPAFAIDVPWAGAAAPVRFRFTVRSGNAQIDDVYVDPYGRS
jgi:opacity protein-like surface antigen